jgi:CDP-diacylglycerol--inositol 3-phosphatidyltransferase
LFIFCFLNESFFVMLYANLFYQGPVVLADIQLIPLLALLAFPVCFGKQAINVIQLLGASQALAQVDVQERRNKQS